MNYMLNFAYPEELNRYPYEDYGRNDLKAKLRSKLAKLLEEKYKIYSYPAERRIVSQEVLTKETYNERTETNTKTPVLFLRLEVDYVFVNIEKPEETIKVTSYGDGVDPQDKAPGKAMTYADKYALMKAYKIITGDDPDQDKSEDRTIVENIGNKVIEQIKAEAMASYIQKEKLEEKRVLGILAKYGYNNLTEIKVKDYVKIGKELEALTKEN